MRRSPCFVRAVAWVDTRRLFPALLHLQLCDDYCDSQYADAVCRCYCYTPSLSVWCDSSAKVTVWSLPRQRSLLDPPPAVRPSSRPTPTPQRRLPDADSPTPTPRRRLPRPRLPDTDSPTPTLRRRLPYPDSLTPYCLPPPDSYEVLNHAGSARVGGRRRQHALPCTVTDEDWAGQCSDQ